MALLEEEGLIHAPHTSPGGSRPTRATALFVDRSQLGQAAVRRPSVGRSSTFLAGAVDLDDVVDRTVRLLATLTRQVAVVQYPP